MTLAIARVVGVAAAAAALVLGTTVIAAADDGSEDYGNTDTQYETGQEAGGEGDPAGVPAADAPAPPPDPGTGDVPTPSEVPPDVIVDVPPDMDVIASVDPAAAEPLAKDESGHPQEYEDGHPHEVAGDASPSGPGSEPRHAASASGRSSTRGAAAARGGCPRVGRAGTTANPTCRDERGLGTAQAPTRPVDMDPAAAGGSSGRGGALPATGAEIRRVAPAAALLIAAGTLFVAAGHSRTRNAARRGIFHACPHDEYLPL